MPTIYKYHCTWPQFLDCAFGELVGNGHCNDETNIADCIYDGGDCCSSDVNREYCYECNCHHEENCALGIHHQVADGLCHDQTNNALCNYDGGDCCGECVNTDYCLNCVCHAESAILQCKMSYFIQNRWFQKLNYKR